MIQLYISSNLYKYFCFLKIYPMNILIFCKYFKLLKQEGKINENNWINWGHDLGFIH